jgi:hypothetical protein
MKRHSTTFRVAVALRAFINAARECRLAHMSSVNDLFLRPRCGEVGHMAITIYGVCAVTFMMSMYALEGRGRVFVLLFAVGCVLSSVYGFLAGAWPFGVVELIWSGIAINRYRRLAPVRSRDA